jgi:ABC-type glutathione transport system ATPase component
VTINSRRFSHSIGVPTFPIASAADAAAKMTNQQEHSEKSVSRSSAENREAEVQQLAKQFTRQSRQSFHSTTGQNPFDAAPGSALDANGDNFNARAWCRAMLHLQTEDPQAHPPRTLGVAFSDLSVHGFGSDTDYQKSVGNVWLDMIGLARETLSLGRKKHKVQILQNLEGLVESGEMLAVLGPPGSGCSTFLKTIAGETYGFCVDKSSSLNFQGKSSRPVVWSTPDSPCVLS